MSKSLGFWLLLLATIQASPESWAGQVTDEIGRTITISSPLKRVVVLTPALSETLFALGLEAMLVGATSHSEYPERARRIPRVGSYVSPSLEIIVSLKPDLVIADKTCNPPSAVYGLEAAGISVYVTNFDDPQRLPEQVLRLAHVCGATESGRIMAEDMRRRFGWLAGLVRDADEVSTLMVLGHAPLISAGADTLQGKLLNLLRGKNIAASAPGRWPNLSLEFVIQARPELVVLTAMEINADLREQVRFWRTLPGLGARPGYRVEMVESDLINRPGPRLIIGAETLARVLHPARFDLEGLAR
ncbi:MAG: helical backbone metal receptor [Thermodesulfobacteriota bacterium]